MVALVLGFSPIASADMILTLDDLAGNSVSITDGGTGDDASAEGAIVFNGTLGAWTINVTTGLSKPVLGDPFAAMMDLTSVNVSSGDPGSLTIMLTDTDFELLSVAPTLLLMNEIGGTTQGTVEAWGYLDWTNEEFGTGGLSVSQGPFGPGAFSDTATAVGTNVADAFFSLTEVVTIVHGAAGQVTSFDKLLTAMVPEPASMLLVGSGLIGLTAFYRRKTKRKG